MTTWKTSGRDTAYVCKDRASGQWVVCFNEEHRNAAFSKAIGPFHHLDAARDRKFKLNMGHIPEPTRLATDVQAQQIEM